MEAWFAILKYRIGVSITDYPSTATPAQRNHGPLPSPLSTMPPSNLDTLVGEEHVKAIYDTSKAKYLLMIANLAEMKEIVNKFHFASSIEIQLLSDKITSLSDTEIPDPPQHVVITGGELFNKGAQAMTFTVVDKIKQKYPGCNVHLLSHHDYYRDRVNEQEYKFDILPWGIEERTSLVSKLSTCEDGIREIFLDDTIMIDVSGYSLSSEFGFGPSFSYMSNFIIAANYNIPVYVLPQSFGPFKYKNYKKAIMNSLLNEYLQYPEVVCCRENDGLNLLSKYTGENLVHETDIVLHHKSYNYKNIFTNDNMNIDGVEVDDESVGIIPNSRLMDRNQDERIYELYDTIIDTLLNENKTVYVLRHAVEDLDICEDIDKRFENESQVRLISDDLNAIQLQNTIEKFDFLVGSRYHSIVHSYKKATPVIAIGWAIKYEELLDLFNQDEYYFDGRESIVSHELASKIEKMSENHMAESQTVENNLRDLNKDIFKEYIFN